MTEVLYATRGTQIGVESTPQTGVAAGKKFTGISISPAVKLEAAKFRAIGNKFPSVVAPNKEWVTAKVSGFPTYDEIVYLLSGLCYAAPAQQGGTAAYKWTGAPALSSADSYKTYSVEQGDSVRAQKFYGGQVTDLGFDFARGGISLNGNLVGLALQDNATMTGTPTVLPAIPILPTQVDVKISTVGQSSLAAASALTRCISCGWSFGNKWSLPWMLGTAQTGFIAGIETAEPALTAKLKLAADSVGLGLLTQMRAGSSVWMRIKATGALIASTYYYDFQTDLALKIVGEPSEFSDEDGIFGMEWNFEGAYDSTWTKTIQWDVINTTTAL
ncbi:MAG: hypothetical protein ABFE02_00240 [Sulfuricella sp.]